MVLLVDISLYLGSESICVMQMPGTKVAYHVEGGGVRTKNEQGWASLVNIKGGFVLT